MSYGSSVLAHPGYADVQARVAIEEPGESSNAYAAELALAYEVLGLGADYRREVKITHETALTYSAVWGCVNAIAQPLSSIGWKVFERRADDPRHRLPVEDDIAWLLDMQANVEMSSMDWRQVMLKDALTWGNGYAEIERTGMGKVNALWRLNPSRVCPVRDGAGRLVYEIDNKQYGKPSDFLPAENVFHLKGLGSDGLVGYSVIEMARKSIHLGLQEEEFGNSFFGRGPMPGGTVTVPGNLSNQQRMEFRRSFEEVYTGAANAHRIVVLSNGVKFEAAELPNDDAQFLESRRFQVSEICRFYRVPPHKLADLERATFSNIEEQEIAFVRDCLLYWARRLESEADIKLFGRTNRGRKFTRLNLDALMRGNSATQTETVTKKVAAGLLMVNEGREYFDLNPIEGGDTALIQGAMVRLDTITGSGVVVPADDEPDTALTPAEGEPAEAPEDAKEAAQAGDVQASALNGAQILALLEIANRQATDQVNKEGSRALIEASFPLLPKELVDKIVTQIDQHEPPAPEPSPAPSPPPPPEEDEEPEEDEPGQDNKQAAAGAASVRRVFAVLLHDAYADLLRVDTDKARRAANKGKLAEHAEEWYSAEARARVHERLMPTFCALALALGWSMRRADQMAEAAAARKVDACYADLAVHGTANLSQWYDWPAAWAAEDLRGIP